MDGEEIRLAKLTRISRETIIKYGTYDMDKAREIGTNHPFYIQLDSSSNCDMDAPDEYGLDDGFVQDADDIVDDSEALAAQIISSNFKTGMSQAEVDAFLQSMV